MIYTVTVNPTIDVTNVLEKGVRLEPDKTFRPESQARHAGGKGIDVSRVIRNLGGRSVAMGFLGGFTGELVHGLLLEEGLELDFVAIRQETRTNVIIIEKDPEDPSVNVDYRFNSPGPVVQPFESLELYKKINALRHLELDMRPTYAAVCGALCKDMKPTFYINILRYFKQMGAIVALDSSGEALKEALRYAPRPDIVKPNIDEFYELMDEAPPGGGSGRESGDCGIEPSGQNCPISQFWEDLFLTIGEFRHRYPKVNALITLGKAGMVLLHEDTLLHARLESSAVVQVVNTVGAGDSALAGLLFELANGKKWSEALKMALATGSAAVECEGTESPTLENVQKFQNQAVVHRHSLPQAPSLVANGTQSSPGPLSAIQEASGCPGAKHKIKAKRKQKKRRYSKSPSPGRS